MPFLPVITGLRTAGMRDRYWDQLSEKLGVDLHPDDSYTLTMYVLSILYGVRGADMPINWEQLGPNKLVENTLK